jgi:hypothetical protein
MDNFRRSSSEMCRTSKQLVCCARTYSSCRKDEAFNGVHWQPLAVLLKSDHCRCTPHTWHREIRSVFPSPRIQSPPGSKANDHSCLCVCVHICKLRPVHLHPHLSLQLCKAADLGSVAASGLPDS